MITPFDKNHKYDLIILGSGAAGLTTALVASIQGFNVLVVEKSNVLGGTTARSSGTVWIPDNSLQKTFGFEDSKVKVMSYLDSLVGDKADRLLRESFVDHAPIMIDYLLKNTNIKFKPYLSSPDYRQDHPGAASGGRALEPQPFDGRLLGSMFKTIASPLKVLMLFGGMMITRMEATTLLKFNLISFKVGAKLMSRYLLDRLKYHRGTRLVLGNALVGALLKELTTRKVCFVLGVDTKKLLINESGDVFGIQVVMNNEDINISATNGVVLAGGGFPSNDQKYQEFLPRPTPLYSPAFEGCQGETIDLGLSAGGVLGKSGLDNAFWFPSSVLHEKNGAKVVYPHIVLDRSKPGLIAVNSNGNRFVNEAVSYHEFVRAMYRTNPHTPSIPSILICAKGFIWKYGFGLIRPRTASLSTYIKQEYLYEANSIEELAIKVGVNPTNLSHTIHKFNTDAITGHDSDFAKGENIYDRSNGDSSHYPNPCLGPINGPPYYAIKVYPTPLGTSRGLVSNEYAQVLNAHGFPIAGLYVCGNDMQSVMGGEYPGAGAQIGIAMTFGYLAARHSSGSM